MDSLTSQIQNLDASTAFWNNLAIIFVALTALVTVGYFVTSFVAARKSAALSRAKDELIRQKDEQLAADLRDKELHIAEANEKAATARAASAKAEEGAAKANERAQNLEQENIRLRTDLEHTTAEARKRQTELTLEQQKMAKEQQKTADALKGAAQTLLSSQFNLQQMRSWLMPRRLISGQNREKFIEALKGQPIATVDIVWQGDMFIGEPRQFAEDITAALKEAGWTIREVKGVLVASDPDPLKAQTAQGVRILSRTSDNPTLSEQTLLRAFLQAGLVADFFPNAQPDGDVIKLLIWMIPPDGGRVLQFQPSKNNN